MEKHNYDYDLIVIGGGSGGVRAARLSAEAGAKVALIEESAMGGTCVNRGCIPKKLMFYSAELRRMLTNASNYGWDFELKNFDRRRFLENQRREILRLNQAYSKNLEKAGVQIVPGTGIFKDSHSVSVQGKTITGKHILIAVGGKPRMPKIPGIEEGITSNEVFELPRYPENLLIVGGGYIAVEMAGIFHQMGVHVSLAYRGELFLRGFDYEIREFLAKEMKESGMNLKFQTNPAKIERTGSQKKVTFEDRSSENYDEVLFCVGREPNLSGLGLENTRVTLTSKGKIEIDSFFQTKDESIFAVGDVSSPKDLTPVAIYEGSLLSGNLFRGRKDSPEYDNYPTAVFSDPNIGTVGLTEEQAKKEFGEIKVAQSRFRTMKNSFAGENRETLMKVIVDKASDRIVGMHMVGDEAGEIIQGFAAAMKAGITFATLKKTGPIHPTTAEEFVTIR